MATTSGSQNLDVSRSVLGTALREAPGRFNFFQMVRLIERLREDRTPVGEFGPPRVETATFGAHNSLAFPPSQIHSLDWKPGSTPRIIVNFLGLTGPMGVLPVAYTELVRDRARNKDRALQDFFDLFHHRILSLFYQAWKKYRFYVPYERDRRDRFSNYLASFVGLSSGALENRSLPAVRDESFLFYSGLLSLQPRSAMALEQLLADYFDVPVEVQEFIGAWFAVPETDQCFIDTRRDFSDTLGTAIAGDEVWDHQSRARVVIGPLKLDRYRDFLPGFGRAHAPLRKLLTFFAGNEIEFEIRLILLQDEVPACELNPGGPETVQLGWTSWIKSADSFGRNPGDTVLLLN